MVPHPKFQLFKGQDNLLYFRLRARNGEILLASEGYAARQSALNGLYVTQIGLVLDRIEHKTAKDGQFFFVVKARNGQIVAVSETYRTLRNAQNATRSAAAIATAPVEDLTLEAPTYPNPKFEIFRGADQDFYFRLRARNGEILLASEGYQSKQGAKRAVQTVRRLANGDGFFEQAISENDLYYFRLVAGNNETVAVSELFHTESARDASILSVVNIADTAPMEDTTLQRIIPLPPVPVPAEAGERSAAAPAAETLEAESGESPVPNPKFQIFEGLDNQYYFRLRARNGEIILQSEGYTSKSGAQLGVGSVRRHGDTRDNYEVRGAKDGSCYFVLRADNGILPGQVIGVSEMYANNTNAEAGIASVMGLAPIAPLEDETKGARVFDHPKYQIFKGKDNEIYFRLTARNGENILSSEGYKAKANANNGIESVRKNAPVAEHFERKVAQNGQFYFVLKSSNGQIIGDSELFSTETARDASIRSVVSIASIAPVEDLILLEQAEM
jgi:uncharacterized protein